MDGDTPARDAEAEAPAIEVRALRVEHEGRLVLRDIGFEVRRGEIFAIVGPSGSGKSSLLRHLAGLQPPAAGQVRALGHDLYDGEPEALARRRRGVGVLFQAGALWSAMTVGDNLMLPLRLHTGLPRAAREQRARFKLALVGLDGAFALMPSQLSGGMRKRAALARALMLDPPLLLLDEPASGLDPLNTARLDELVLQLRDHLGTTVVVVTHDLDSVFALADRMLYLDDTDKTMAALGAPRTLLHAGPPRVRAFLGRHRPEAAGPSDRALAGGGPGA